MKKLRFAIFGVGRMGVHHLSNIENHPYCEIAYIFDTNLKAVSKLKKNFRTKSVKDPEKIFQDQSVDVVFI